MNGAGFDWLNMAGLSSESSLPPPPVSFGVTPTSSTSSLSSPKHESTVDSSDTKNETKTETNGTKKINPGAEEDHLIPLCLNSEQLTKDEVKTYLRWYNDILVRKGTKLIRLQDVFNFLNNFHLSLEVRRALERIFRACSSLNIGEFFALLRVISHTILGASPSRRLIQKPAPIPKPKSILAKRRLNESDEDDNNETNNVLPSLPQATTNNNSGRFDLDTFTQFILTGERPEAEKRRRERKKKHTKRVKFSDQVMVEPEIKPVETEPVKLDLSLPMDQLLNILPQSSSHQPEKVNEEEELKEMEDSFNYFRNIKNVDSALIHGVPSNIPSIFFDELKNNSPSPDLNQQILSPHHTGTANATLLSPSHTGSALYANGLLSPSHTGGALLSPSHTGGHMHSSSRTSQHDGTFLMPSYTGGAIQNIEPQIVPLAPTMTGSLSSAMRNNMGLLPSAVNSTSQQRNFTPPLPPQRRNRSSSSPISFDPNHALGSSTTPRISSPLGNAPVSSNGKVPPPAPPSRSRSSSHSTDHPHPPPSRGALSGFPISPALPPKIELKDSNVYNQAVHDFAQSNGVLEQQSYFPPYNNNESAIHGSNVTGGTADILGDLKALQFEVDRLQHYPQ